jgi:hypothetical protein
VIEADYQLQAGSAAVVAGRLPSCDLEEDVGLLLGESLALGSVDRRR